MSDLHLIAHKVRGKPAFDIAERMCCPMCAMDIQGAACHECDGLGYWWIIPTSGQRAYPWWSAPLADIDDTFELAFNTNSLLESPGPMPAGLPDHYPHRAEPTRDLASILGIIHAPLAPIKRRF